MLALLSALLVAFLWQSIATGSHLHFEPGTFAADTANQAAVPQVTRPQAPGDLPINCPLCHDAAIAGHFLFPGTTLVAPLVLTARWRQRPAPMPARSVVARALPWRSRAPPRAGVD